MDHVFNNDSCIPKKDCFICDKDGHVQGDIWHPNKCTECNCNDGVVNCQTMECPVLDTICEENMTPVLINGTEERCCAKYLCGELTYNTTGKYISNMYTYNSLIKIVSFSCEIYFIN